MFATASTLSSLRRIEAIDTTALSSRVLSTPDYLMVYGRDPAPAGRGNLIKMVAAAAGRRSLGEGLGGELGGEQPIVGGSTGRHLSRLGN